MKRLLLLPSLLPLVSAHVEADLAHVVTEYPFRTLGAVLVTLGVVLLIYWIARRN